VIKFVSDLRQVDGFLRVLQFPVLLEVALSTIYQIKPSTVNTVNTVRVVYVFGRWWSTVNYSIPLCSYCCHFCIQELEMWHNIGLFLFKVNVMVFNATFKYTSAISWRSVLLVEETEYTVKSADRSQITVKRSHTMLYRVHLALSGFWPHNIFFIVFVVIECIVYIEWNWINRWYSGQTLNTNWTIFIQISNLVSNYKNLYIYSFVLLYFNAQISFVSVYTIWNRSFDNQIGSRWWEGQSAVLK